MKAGFNVKSVTPTWEEAVPVMGCYLGSITGRNQVGFIVTAIIFIPRARVFSARPCNVFEFSLSTGSSCTSFEGWGELVTFFCGHRSRSTGD